MNILLVFILEFAFFNTYICFNGRGRVTANAGRRRKPSIGGQARPYACIMKVWEWCGHPGCVWRHRISTHI